MEKKLKSSENHEQYRELVEASPVAICVQGNDKVIFVNKAGMRLFGAGNLAQLIGKSVMEFVHLDNLKTLGRRFQQIIEEGTNGVPFEGKIVRIDGRVIDVDIESAPFQYKGRQAIQIIFRESTKRKKIEELLLQSKHDWEETFNNITDMITIHDKDFNIISANKTAQKILKLPLLEVNKLIKCFEYYHGKGCPPKGCPSCECLKTGKPANFELFEPHLNMHIEIRAMPRFNNKNNELVGLVHIVRDVTERKRAEEEVRKAKDELEVKVEQRTSELRFAIEQLKEEVTERMQVEEALRKSETKFKNLSQEFNVLLDAIPDNLILLSPDLEIEWVNKAAASGFDKKISELNGQYCYKICCHLTSPCEDCPTVRSFLSGREEATQLTTSEGNIWDIRAFPISNKSEGVKNVIEVARNVTEKAKLEAETMRTRHLASLGELAAGVAHEINNPINNIINYAQILLDEFEKEKRDKDIAHRMIKDSDRIATIVRSLLSFARVKKKEKDILNLYEIFSDVLALTKAQMKKEGINLDINISSDLPEIIAHPQEIQQVFLNIISNSRFALNKKYPEPHKDKTIRISCEETRIDNSRFIRITFYDQGTGIPANILDNVINPFFTTKEDGLGTGLGLSISHRIIIDLEGKFVINSVEGKYTMVNIFLPAKIKVKK